MPMMEWKDNFNLGVEQFDLHHRHLVDLLNRAYDGYLQDENLESLTVTLNELFDYAIDHFSVEERYMEETNYASFAEHLEYHKGFLAQVAVMRKDLKAVWKNLPLEMLAFLKNWLSYDILIADTEYVRYSSSSQWKQCA